MFGIPNDGVRGTNSVGRSKHVSRGSFASCLGCYKLHENSGSFRNCMDGNSVGNGNLVSTCSVSIITARLGDKMDDGGIPTMRNDVDLTTSGGICGTNRAVALAMGNGSLVSLGTLDFTLPCDTARCRFVKISIGSVNGVRGLAGSHLRSSNDGILCPAFIGVNRRPTMRNARSLFAVGLGTGGTYGPTFRFGRLVVMSGFLNMGAKG